MISWIRSIRQSQRLFTVLSEYKKYLFETPVSSREVRDQSVLPASKDEILESICYRIRNKNCGSLETRDLIDQALKLAFFLPDVGPMSAFFFSVDYNLLGQRPDDYVGAIFQSKADRDLEAHFAPLVKAEASRISTRLKAILPDVASASML